HSFVGARGAGNRIWLSATQETLSWTADRSPFETVTAIEPVAAELLWTSAQVEMLPLESVFTSHIELLPSLLNWFVEPAAMNPPSLACWKEWKYRFEY